MNNTIFNKKTVDTDKNVIQPSKCFVWKKNVIFSILFCALIFNSLKIEGQTSQNIEIPSGSFIINMGVLPQTINNGLKPYGLVYALLNIHCPVYWVINTSKVKDGADFAYNGIDYKGGTFIIDAKYRTSEVNALITTWTNPTGQFKVVGVTTTSPVIVPVYLTFLSAPRWTMDLQNGSLVVPYFANAGIPASAYGGASTNWKTPDQLDCCDDIFAMAHADPTWATHGHLREWVMGNGTSNGCKGGIWLGCHAGSALMDMFDNITQDGDAIDFNEQTNFLVDKIGPAVGNGPYSENALLLWGNHNDGTPPYSYDYSNEPIMQFMGSVDAALQNGSEQIYIPKSGGWFANTHVGVYDPDHTQRYLLSNDKKYRAAAIVYGPAGGIEGNGKIMIEAGHSFNGTAPANVAAQRAFLNYSFLVAWEKSAVPRITNFPSKVYSQQPTMLAYNIEANVPPAITSTYTTSWSSSCGGTFTNIDSTTGSSTFIPPIVSVPTYCNISVTITDSCGRKSFDTQLVMIMPCELAITKNIVPVSCNGEDNGSIGLEITGGTQPYAWSWNRTNSPIANASGSSTSSSFTLTNLIAGTYSVTVSDVNVCKSTFIVQVTQPASLSAAATAVNTKCFGTNTGSIDLTVNGGTAPYSYLWSNNATTEDLVNVAAGTYNVTVTDAKGCTATTSAIIAQPASALSLNAVATNIDCKGNNNATINITATGGTSPYTYDWVDIAGTNDIEDRTALAAGTYSISVTDANNCVNTQSFTITEPEKLVLSGTVSQPTCPSTATITGNNGAIDLTVIGGTTSYSFVWTASGGGVVPSGQANGKDLTNLVSGIYTVSVTDSNGCTVNASFTLLNQFPNPVQPGSINH